MTPEIDKSVISVIKDHQKQAPVDVYQIAAALGLSVVEMPLGTDVSGKISKNWRGQYQITVNRNDHPNRKRFTVAHEIAHFVLHRDLIGDGFSEDAMYRGPLGGSSEIQANRLAADILMPYFLIESEYSSGTEDHYNLARRFEVSPRAMEIRLEGFKRSRQSAADF